MENENIVFEDFLRNSLSEEEQTSFRQSLDRDPEFRKRFEFYKSVRDTMTKDKTKEQALRSKLVPLDEKYFNTEHSATDTSPIRKLMFFKLAAALAILVAAIFAFQQFQSPQFTPAEIADNHFYERNLSTDRAEGPKPQNIFEQNYAAANKAFKAGNYAEAINNYQQILGSKHALVPYAEWNLLLVYYRSGIDEYKVLLEKISQDTAHPFYDKAVALKKEIE